MKTIIFGASSRASLGYYLGQYLKRKYGHNVLYASRSGRLGVKCNINNPKKILSILSKEKPDLVINAAGVFNDPQILGFFKKFDKVKNHILVKSFGALVLADAIAKTPSVKYFIVLGGRAISSESGFASYSISNGALWALVKFFAKHNHTADIFYIDLPLIKNTTMSKFFVALSGHSNKQTGMKSVTNVVGQIIKGKYKNGSRIVINKQLGL